MSKSAVKISLDLLSNPLCEQDQDFLNMVTALDTAMKRMDAFNQEKVTRSCCPWPVLSPSPWVYLDAVPIGPKQCWGFSRVRPGIPKPSSSQTRLVSCPCLL